MRAFVVNQYGKDGLRAGEVPEPRVGPRDVLVRVCAASINPLDKMVRNGEFKQLIPYALPFTLGHDLSGVVLEVGSRVTAFQIGDEVYARPRDLRIGAFAERIALDEADLALKPKSLTMAEAAAVPLVALAAWQSLNDLAHVRPGQKVLIHAGAGGLGATAVQVAKHLGAYVATTTHTRDVEKARGLGADRVLDYTQDRFEERLSGYDVVLDSLGPDSLSKSMSILKPGGLAISVVGPPDPSFAAQLERPVLKPVMWWLSRHVRAQAKQLGVRYAFFFMKASGSELQALASLYDAGILRPMLDRTFPFDQTLDAMSYVESGQARGKVVIVMTP